MGVLGLTLQTPLLNPLCRVLSREKLAIFRLVLVPPMFSANPVLARPRISLIVVLDPLRLLWNVPRVGT